MSVVATLDVSNVARLDLTMRRGTAWTITCRLTNGTSASNPGTAVSLAGCAVRGDVRPSANSSTATATLSGSVTDASDGQHTVEMTTVESEKPSANGATATDSTDYVWTAEVYNTTTAAVLCTLTGTLSVFPKAPEATP